MQGDRPRLLVVWHSRSGGTARLAEAVLDGARTGAEAMVEIDDRSAPDAGPDDVLAADAVIIGTPERFGAVAGMVKDFLERIYHPCLDHTRGRPWGLFVKAGNDGAGAVRDVERIITGLAWKAVAPPVVAVGEVSDAHLEAAWELGATTAAGLAGGLW